MKRLIAAVATACVLVFAAVASAALEPGVYDPGNTGCPKASFSHGVLHLEKNCATSTDAAAGADITGLNGQTFQSASFTLASTSQCQGGSPRFNIYTTDGTFFLGCNNVVPDVTTYTFTQQSLADAGNQVPFPTGTITGAAILIDVQGTADISNIKVNGTLQVPVIGPPTSANQCKNGGWKDFNNPPFKNQGQCVAYFNKHKPHGKSAQHRHNLKHH
jgi:hypothetical protein